MSKYVHHKLTDMLIDEQEALHVQRDCMSPNEYMKFLSKKLVQ